MSDAEVVDNKSKKQRSEAQQQAFKRAVEKLKAKRDVEREAKAAARAELDLKKTEEKAVVLKARVERAKKPAVTQALQPVPTAIPEPTKPDYSDVLKQVTLSIERVLDERLPKPRAVERSLSPPQRKSVTRQPATVHQSMPPAWYEAVFAARR
jgi:hypothetical protein